MLSFHELRSFAVDLRHRVNEVRRVELITAVITLVATGSVVTANGAGALNVAVGQSTPCGGADSTGGFLRHQVAVLRHIAEHLLHDGVVVTGGGPRKQVVGEPQTS